MSASGLARVAWVSELTGARGYGAWLPADVAQGCADAANRRYPQVRHWVEYQAESSRRPCCARPPLRWCERLAVAIPPWHAAVGGSGVPPAPATRRPSRLTSMLVAAALLGGGR